MRDRAYGQFCGLARAAEVLGQRWTLLVLRDLLVSPRRYSDLMAGLPGIPSSGLASRLRELEDDGLVRRAVSSSPDRSVLYHATDRARELLPALDALARWGAADMHQPRAGEVVTEASLVSALRSAAQQPRSRSGQVVYQVIVGDAAAHVILSRRSVLVRPGHHRAADLTIEAGPRFRDVLAGELDAGSAVETGTVHLVGDHALFPTFLATFYVPYTANTDPTPANWSAQT